MLVSDIWYHATLHVMISELDELLIQGDSNWAKLTLSLSLVHALKTGIIKVSLWWRDGRWKRTIGCSCPSKIQTGLGRRPSRKILTDYKETCHSLDQTCRRWWWSSSTAPAVSSMEAEGLDFFSKLAAQRLQSENVHSNNDNAVQPQSV